MKRHLWKSERKENDGFRHQSQIRGNLEEPIEEEPETLELAVRANEDVQPHWPDQTENNCSRML
jgi:hypothetical protein